MIRIMCVALISLVSTLMATAAPSTELDYIEKLDVMITQTDPIPTPLCCTLESAYPVLHPPNPDSDPLGESLCYKNYTSVRNYIISVLTYYVNTFCSGSECGSGYYPCDCLEMAKTLSESEEVNEAAWYNYVNCVSNPQ